MTLKERTDALARVPVFAGLSWRSLERIARIAKDVELRPVLSSSAPRGTEPGRAASGAPSRAGRAPRSRGEERVTVKRLTREADDRGMFVVSDPPRCSVPPARVAGTVGIVVPVFRWRRGDRGGRRIMGRVLA